MSINLNQCTGVCHNCVKHYISKYRIQKGCGKTFEVECSGIPIKYIPDSILSSLGGDTSSIVAMLDPVTWAAKYLDWHCVDPDGEIWKRKTTEGTLPSESRPYDPILAKQGRSIFHRPYQLEMLACSSRRKVFRCGRQLGKTECLCIAILYALWTKGNFKIVLIAPYQSQIEMIFGRLMSAIQGSSQLSNSVAHSVKAPSYKIEMNNGSQIIGFTAGTRSGQDAGAARGQPANMLVFDEADYLSPGDIGATLATIVNSPSATVWMSSTPTGRREKFYETCHNPLYKEFYFPSQVNPNWGESEEKYYRSEYTEDQYKHEILAEFGEQEEGVYQVKYVEAAQSNYTYEQMKPTRSWTYMMGVDWNDIKIGTTIAIVGFNPQDNKFKVVDKHIISKGERTQLSACNKIAELNRLWFPDYIYVDRGFGATQVEVLHEFGARALQSQGPNSPDARLRQIVKEYDFGSAIKIHDLFSKQEVKKSAKPFLVDNSVRRFESLQIQYPKSDTHYTEQLLGYTIQRVSMTGLPVYQASERAGDHFLDAVNLALIAFLLEKTAYGKPTYTYDIAIAGKFGDLEGPHLDKNIVGRVSKDHSSDRSSLFKKEERLITSTPQLPACNTSKTSNLPLWSWPGWSRDLPAPKSKNHNNRRQFRPHRVKF
jgi:hypothetical protein